MISPVTIKSYLPQEKRERSKLQQVKDKHRSFTQTSNEGIPKDLKELKAIKYREHAITFLNQFMNINKKMSKSAYCKSNHISHNSLNAGLKLLGYKTRLKETNSRLIETTLGLVKPVEHNRDHQVKPVTKRERNTKKVTNEIKGGVPYEDDEIKELITNSLANIHIS